MKFSGDFDAHASRCSGDHLHRGRKSESVEVWHLAFSDRLNLIPCYGGHFPSVRFASTFLKFGSFLEGNGYWWLLYLEREGLV